MMQLGLIIYIINLREKKDTALAEIFMAEEESHREHCFLGYLREKELPRQRTPGEDKPICLCYTQAKSMRWR